MQTALIFNSVVLATLFIYYFLDREKAFKALDLAWKSFKKVLPLLLLTIFLIIILQQVISGEFVIENIQKFSGIQGHVLAALAGAIIHIPLFVTFPLAGQLLQSGINPGVIAVLITSFVMVHTFTIPLEIKEMGLKFAVVRNSLALFASILIGLLVGVFF